jgi:predicted nucleotidyltransferase
MPVRSLSSSVLRWPDRRAVEAAVRRWAQDQVPAQPGLVALGYFGSYARGDCGVGSDLDLVAIVHGSNEPFERRSLTWDLSNLPVPAEILVYTSTEWRCLLERGGRFATTLRDETVWIWHRRGGEQA